MLNAEIKGKVVVKEILFPLVAVVYFSLFVLGLGDNVRGPIFPEIIRDFSLSQTQASLFFSISSTLSFIATFSSRFYLNQISRKKFFILAQVIMLLGTFVFILSSSTHFLFFGSCLFGAGMGLLGVAQNLMISELDSGKRGQKLLSGLHSTYALSSLLAPILVNLIYSSGYKWNHVFAVVAFFIAVCLLLGSFYVPDTNAHIKEVHLPKNKSHIFPQIIFAVCLGLYVASELIVSTRMPHFLREQFGFDLNKSNLYLTYYFILMFVGRLSFTFIHFDLKIKTQLIISLILSFVFFSLGIWVEPLFLCLTGLVQAPYYPLSMTLASKLFKSELASAISFCLGFSGLFVVLMHTFVGIIAERFGILQSMYVGLFAIVATVVHLQWVKNET